MNFSGEVRRGAVRIEVLANKMRKQMEIDAVEYPNSRELAIELKRIYEALEGFSNKLDEFRNAVDTTTQSVWSIPTPVVPVSNNVISFQKSNK